MSKEDPEGRKEAQRAFSHGKGLEGMANYIKDMNPKIVVITGAQLSAQVGFPDLRSKDSGLYHAPMVEGTYFCDVLSKERFLQDPWPLYDLIKHLAKLEYTPTLSHFFVLLLHMKGLLLRNYTLSSDDLELCAGLPLDKLVSVYGTWWAYSCSMCGRNFSVKWFFWKVLRSRLPQCDRCTGLVRPDILLYRDPLPESFLTLGPVDFKECGLLVVLGSTLSHEPLASYLRQFGVVCPKLFISDVEPYQFSDFDFFGDEGQDVLWLGSCDAGVKRFAKLLGWDQELADLAGVDLPDPPAELIEPVEKLKPTPGSKSDRKKKK